MKTTLSNLLSWGTKELKSANIPNPQREANLLAEFILEKNPLLLDPQTIIPVVQTKKFQKSIHRRSTHEPFAYITGEVIFCNHKIQVNKHTLIPRPETEILVDLITNYLSCLKIENFKLKIIEVGTGSGAISIALASKFPDLNITATDKYTQTLKQAQKNIDYLLKECHPDLSGGIGSLSIDDIKDPASQTTNQITLIKGDLLSPFNDNSLDIIIANLPYIPENIQNQIDSTVKDFEPYNALFSGPDGLDLINKLLKQARSKIKPKGVIFLEIWPTQTEAIKNLAQKYWPTSQIIFHPDLEGTTRFAQINL